MSKYFFIGERQRARNGFMTRHVEYVVVCRTAINAYERHCEYYFHRYANEQTNYSMMLPATVQHTIVHV